MKALIVALISSITFVTQGQEAEVKQTIATFFEGFHQCDTLKIQTVCSKTLRIQSSIESQLKGRHLVDETPQDFFKSIAKMPKSLRFEERLLNYSIQIDNSIATVWIPYEFYIEQQLSHSGVNVFVLFNDNESWKIIYIIDTRRRP